MNFCFSLSNAAVSVKVYQDQQNWYKKVKLNTSYYCATFTKSHLNSHQETADVISLCQLYKHVYYLSYKTCKTQEKHFTVLYTVQT